MELTHIAELLTPFIPAAELDDTLLHPVSAHLELLLRWNQRMNLTALRSPSEIVERHFGESLFAARQLFPRDATDSLFDLGSGAGFPGVPMQCWAPSLKVTLIEGHGKKATFLREVGRTLHSANLSVLNLRGEAVPEKADVVTLRAVEKFEQVLPVAASLVAPGGRLAILIGETQRERALELIGVSSGESFAIPGSSQRIVLLCRPQKD